MAPPTTGRKRTAEAGSNGGAGAKDKTRNQNSNFHTAGSTTHTPAARELCCNSLYDRAASSARRLLLLLLRCFFGCCCFAVQTWLAWT
jgi:hypothetical protein